MTQYERSTATLELPAVLAMLEHEAVSDLAKSRALTLAPSTDEAEVRRRLAETSAARGMMVTQGSPSFSGVKDVRPSLQRAEMGGVLNTRELTGIAGVLAAARAAKSYAAGDGKREKTCIDYLFQSLQANRYLEDKITSSIAGEDEIADAASAELANIRRLIRAASARVREALQKIICSPSYAKGAAGPDHNDAGASATSCPSRRSSRTRSPAWCTTCRAPGRRCFVEPMAAVKANNELRELRAREKAEIERILAELSADCAEHADGISLDFDLLVRLDLIFAKARLSYALDAAEPELSEREIRLHRARHPAALRRRRRCR